ncbi:peptidylprolyl isomerase [Polymorphobacter arshaanensis]|uniref:Parvulin-like PPIase n=1 Tax=Glacieibacterium arshaanense TaxID=2511025 RepID=A0A4Y9EPT9_9SPHN|nr:peptidylprolyl isomerase [Polymorphobacter arshaanensis]TFU03730.1 peptidylprolyl isomerase [Polymorphobacter arshaanensis]
MLSRFRLVLAAALLGAGMSAMPVLAQQGPGQEDMGFDSPELRVLGQADPSVRKATVIVNGDIITDTDVEQRLNLVIAANGAQISPDERNKLRLQVLRNLIDEKLEIQEAASNEIRISDAEVEKAFQRVAANFKQTPEQFSAFLVQNGASAASIKAQIRGEMAWSRLLRRKVEPTVTVGDEEVQALLDKLNAAKGTEEYRVGEIFLSATPENQARVMADAQRIVQQIRGGASFVAYARQFSEASTAGVGGELGWVRAGQLNDAVGPVVTALQPATISDPIVVPGGIAIMALIEKRQVLAADPANAVLSLKQMAIQFKPGITEPEAKAVVANFQKVTQDMGGCGRVETVAKEIGATVAINDAIRIKDLPPALQEMMKTLSVGQATPPFGSAKDGVRVLVLCGRDDAGVKAQSASFDEVYAQLNEERVNMRARRYLRDLRRDAVIDYR